MACIIKLPSADSKGVITFTTQERDRLINKDPKIRKQVEDLKQNWITGLHHNWHDYQFKYDSVFDFSMAGEDDLIEKDGKKFNLIPMDACNFVPEYFKPAQGEKFWDILYVARAVYFKKIPEFFECIRKLYDQGHRYRVLFICPVPPYKWSERKSVFYDIRKVYDKMFTEEEKNYFTLLTLNYRYPFPFDLETLAFYYRSSKTFVHFADDEKRCRVAAYAWASGVPVIGMSCVGSLISKENRKEPFYYEITDYKDFPQKIVSAVEASHQNNSFENLQKELVSTHTGQSLAKALDGLFSLKNNPHAYLLNNLDIRLGRHLGISKGANNLECSLKDFLTAVRNNLKLDNKVFDPEVQVIKLLNSQKG